MIGQLQVGDFNNNVRNGPLPRYVGTCTYLCLDACHLAYSDLDP